MLVYEHMETWSPSQVTARANGSHNTSTHYKWLVHRDDSHRFTLWIHDYKLAGERGPGYAEVPHNHRYDLCSIILDGGYTSVLYNVKSDLLPIEKPTFRVGDVLSLRHYEIHALTEICEGTLTLFVEGPTITDFSTVFYLDGKRRNFVDFHGRREQFLERLKSSER
jgi:predicted metal-dependent enzyme (double-stranded beta helix superfamily)